MTLNEHNGGTISDLELTLTAVKKLLRKRLEENPKAGLVMSRGKKNEARMRYRDMAKVIESLEAKLSLEGCFSMGVCKTCKKFNPKVSGKGCFGSCGNSDKLVHEYDSCADHSKKGGGYGV